MYDEEIEETFVLRHNNRAQRSVNRALRRALKQQQLHNDELFEELCNYDMTAEMALERIWSECGLSCDVHDFDAISDICIEAIKGFRVST